MPFPNIELPADFHVPRINDRSRDKRLANLRNGPGTGRAKGLQNKICRDLKEGLLEGAILHGYNGLGEGGLVGYCHYLAERHPKAYANLLGKLLPLNLTANAPSAGIGQVTIVSVPSGTYLSPDQIACAKRGEAFTIEHDQSPEAPIEAPAPCEAPSSEEEDRIIDNLKAEINELARKAGLSLVV